MDTELVVIQKSKVNGVGIFAPKNYEKGETIIEWDKSHILEEEEVDSLTDIEKKYIIFADDNYIIMQKPEKFANHSCYPNAFSKDFCYIASRNIEKGEEITIEYSKKIPLNCVCSCGSLNCKDRNLLQK